MHAAVVELCLLEQPIDSQGSHTPGCFEVL